MEVNLVLLKSEPQTKMFYSRYHLAIIDPYLIGFIFNVPTSHCFSTALGNVIHNGESFPTQFFHASWQKKTLVAIELFLLLSAHMSWGSLYFWKCFFIVRSYFFTRNCYVCHFAVLACNGRLHVYETCALLSMAWNTVLVVHASKGSSDFVHHIWCLICATYSFFLPW